MSTNRASASRRPFLNCTAACLAFALLCLIGCGSDAPDVFDGVLHPIDAGESGTGGVGGVGGTGGVGGVGGTGGVGGVSGTGGTGGIEPPPGGIGDPCPPLGCDGDLICRAGFCAALSIVGEACTSALDCEDDLICKNDLCAALAAVGEGCDVSSDCESDLTCVNQLCAADGTLGAPCRLGTTCDEGLGCSAGTCIDTINVRFCHCIYLNGGANTLSLSLQLGNMSIGPTLSNTCTPCIAIPASTTPLTARVVTPGGTTLLDSTFTPDPSLTTVVLATDVNGTQVINSHCNAINNLCGF